MAASRRQELNIPPDVAAQIGKSAVEAARAGYYVNQAGEQVNWRSAVDGARLAKKSIAPDDQLPTPDEVFFGQTEVQVTNETTLMASRRFIGNGLQPLVLNFANGVQPGGGFLYGARLKKRCFAGPAHFLKRLLTTRCTRTIGTENYPIRPTGESCRRAFPCFVMMTARYSVAIGFSIF